MPASFWYFGIIAVSIVLLTVALRHKSDWKLLVLQLNIASIIHPFEIFVFATNGYVYKPNIFFFPTGADNYLGAFISDFLIIPASAVIIHAFSLSRPVILCIAAVFTGIDWFFTVLGIYQHFWWKSVYTGIGLLFLYTISDWLWTNIKNQRQSRLFRLLIIHLTYFPLQSALFFAANRGGVLFQMHIPHLQFYIPELMPILVSLYQLIISITAAICLGLKMPWRYRTLGIGVVVSLNWAIGNFGIFVPLVKITHYHLIIPSIAALVIMIALFRAAKLDYLLP